jgi:hypothetical protein
MDGLLWNKDVALVRTCLPISLFCLSLLNQCTRDAMICRPTLAMEPTFRLSTAPRGCGLALPGAAAADSFG